VTGAGALLVASFAAPLAMLAACLSPRARARMPALLGLAPLPGLAAALLAHAATPLVLDETRLRFTLALDTPRALLLGVAALLWAAAGVYAGTWLRGDPKAGRFAEWWLLTLAGSLGVFVAADLFSFYIAYALVSLPAWGLVAYDETVRTRRAGAIYLGFAVLGEICLLLAFALLAAAAPGETLAIADVVAALPFAPGRDITLALLIAGFGLKIGLVPLHVWMPLTYSAAPHPAAAVLSGAAVKAGVIGLILFLPFGAALPGWGAALTVAGLLAAFYGVAIGITQPNPKTVLAYSSVSQMGGLAAILGMGLASADNAAVSAVSFSAAHHVLVKGALFLALGVVAASGARQRSSVLVPAAILSLALGGLPLTGGALAKLASKAPLGAGSAATLATLASAGTTLLMLHFLTRLAHAASADPRAKAPIGLVVPWLATAVAALAVPWLLAPSQIGVTAADLLAPAELWAALWPIGLGAALALILRRFAHALPTLPEGDVLVLGAPLVRGARALSDALERLDARLREWPVAGVALLALAILLYAAIRAGS
jgi:formate hydrogenlyase subunit 3/multisubunit Na+/H+ antiporter MnhD subunit